ncbi:hypothetical protein VNO77_23354 [Canavalia gladiata]|uniref:Uncharacterized protein n=1 Tax=Canavalia gladiata TaxID=3824 RepID=A0AAN9L4S9_CANGL
MSSGQGNEWTEVLLHARKTYQSSLCAIWALESRYQSSKYALHEANAWPLAWYTEHAGLASGATTKHKISTSTPDAHVIASNQQWSTTPSQAYPSILIAQPTMQKTLPPYKALDKIVNNVSPLPSHGSTGE